MKSFAVMLHCAPEQLRAEDWISCGWRLGRRVRVHPRLTWHYFWRQFKLLVVVVTEMSKGCVLACCRGIKTGPRSVAVTVSTLRTQSNVSISPSLGDAFQSYIYFQKKKYFQIPTIHYGTRLQWLALKEHALTTLLRMPLRWHCTQWDCKENGGYCIADQIRDLRWIHC